MPEADPTNWELMRVLRDLQTEFRAMRTESVTKEGFREFQREVRATNERIGGEVAKERADRKEGIAGAVAERKLAIAEEAADREKGDARLEARIDRIGSWVKYGVTTAIGVLTTVIGWMLTRGGS